MSRCFPFPPPGYEKKPSSDHADLLAKEKLKEKKHKKEKNKEKREGKERKDKDRSKDKHKEKKDRKEKHKDKKRDKDRDRDKSRSSDDGRIEEQTDAHNEQKLGDSSQKFLDVKDSKFTEELGRRIRDEEKGATNRMPENFIGSIQKRPDSMGSAAVVADSVQKRMGVVGLATEMEKERSIGSKVVPNLASTEQKRAIGNEMAPNLISTEQRRAIGNEMAPNLIRTEQRRTIGNEVVPKIISTEQRRNDMARSLEDTDKRIEGKEKRKNGEAADAKQERHKDKYREEEKGKGKEKDKHKEKEKEKAREKGEYKHKEHDKSKDNGRKDKLDSLNCNLLAPHRDNGKSTDTNETIKRRKHLEMNGFLLESDAQPNKFPRLASPPHLPVENGRTLQSCQTVPYSIMKDGAMNNIKAEKLQDNNKKLRINGITEALPFSVGLKPSAAVENRENGKASSKPPHPDSKYLRQIYSIPKMDEWPEFDDQKWLFGSKNCQLKPKSKFEVEETPVVWAEALQIDSADVLALPYVVPY